MKIEKITKIIENTRISIKSIDLGGSLWRSTHWGKMIINLAPLGTIGPNGVVFGHAPMDLGTHHPQVAHKTVYKNPRDNA
jgi:hypothetical protein